MPVMTAPGRIDGRSERWRVHREERRDQLVQATVVALDRFGPEVSLEQIAAVAEISKPKIYRYFEDRAALIDAVGEWLRAAVRERVDAAAVAEATIRDGLDRSLRALYGFIDEHPNAFQSLRAHQHTDQSDTPVLAEVVRWAARPLLSLLVGPDVSPSDAAGATQEAEDAEPAIQVVLASVLGAGDWWLGQPQETRMTVDRLVANLSGVLIGAVEAASGVVGLAARPLRDLEEILASRRATHDVHSEELDGEH